jgi:hypothetical protein
MKYSFKKHIHNENYINTIYVIIIVSFGACMLFVIFMGIFGNINTIKELIFFFIIALMIFFIIQIIPLMFLLLRVHSIKKLLNNYSEVNAKIEKYREIRYRGGQEAGLKVYFSYIINNKYYYKVYSIVKNKYTNEYYGIYKEPEKTVKLLVENENPKKIMIKEIFM